MFEHFSPVWRVATEHFLAQLFERSGSQRTVGSYEMQLRRFFVAPLTPELATRTDVLEFLSRASESKRNPGGPVKAATRNAKLCALTSFYRWVSSYEVDGEPLYQKVSPTTGFKYGKPDEYARALSEEELEAFFGAIADSSVISLRDKSIYVTFLACARRRSELAALKWGDIQESMIVDTQGQRHRGHVYKFFGKGHARMEDTQELPEYAYDAIVAYLVASGRYETIGPDDPIWVSTRPGTGTRGIKKNVALCSDYLNQRMLIICARAGIERREGLSLHSWRHSSALHRYAEGEDLLSLKRLLRHSNIATTSRYLTQLSGEADPGASRLQAKFSFLR